MKKLAVFIFFAIMSASFAQKYKDGVYHSQSSKPIHGWITVVEIEIEKGEITKINVEDFDKDYKDRSTDVDDNKNLKKDIGVTYPQIASDFESQFMAKKDLKDIDAIAGATSFYKTFKMLTNSALEAAEKGETTSNTTK